MHIFVFILKQSISNHFIVLGNDVTAAAKAQMDLTSVKNQGGTPLLFDP